MNGFIELTDYESNERILVRIETIISISKVIDGTFVETFVDGQGTGGYCVRESYTEIKNKLCEV